MEMISRVLNAKNCYSIFEECSRMLLIMSVISFSVLMTSYEEIDINWIGLVYQMGGVVGEALRLIFMEIFVKMKGLKLNPIFVMYYVSPCSALYLFILWIFLEKPKMDAQGTWSFQPVILTLNSLCTFALNLSVFLVILHTSDLTILVAGVVKDWVVVLLSALLFADTMLTMINLFGYGIAIAGVAAYNNHKLKKEASQGSFDESQHAESRPLTSSSTIESNQVKKLCDLCNITVNKNVVFGDNSALSPGGVRIGDFPQCAGVWLYCGERLLWVYVYFPTLAPEMLAAEPLVTPYSLITWQPWAPLGEGLRFQFAGGWGASRYRILFEGPVGRTWFLGERFLRQVWGYTSQDPPSAPPDDMRIADMLISQDVVNAMLGVEHI
ncbi:probable sugar phosphate/phosphate translocator At3g14410 [Camellia sinensis]|uniref:probable sugar phosphate/phosphate translocator At3g14410 n=1 Tax=Camellia sinensis TaxID=4442 RepID=UPI0010356470|nr:probable sugar phosphate/phosphate translocator At3g14410 [Camellia sinensis]